MARDANTPLILWICAAFCAHLMFGEGGDQVAQFHDDRLAIATFGEKVRERVLHNERTFDLALDLHKGPEVAEPKPPEPPPPPKPKATPKPVATATPPKPEQKKAPPEVTPQKKIAIAVVPEEPGKKLLEQQIKTDRRISVVQHAQPNQ